MSDPLYQFDYGQRLIIDGVDLPQTYEVHFSNAEFGDSTTSLGDNTGVDIPDIYLTTGKDVYAWLYLHTGTEDGETVFKFVIPVRKRAMITDAQPTPVQQDVITQAIGALNVAVEETGADALEAEGYAVGTQNGTPVGSGSPYYENNAKYYSEQAGSAAQNIIDDTAGDGVTNKTWSANKLYDTFGTKANVEHPLFTGSISMGRKAGSTKGANSVATGSDVIASMSYAHAEGYKTNAGSVSAHAEGNSTTAAGTSSHAEGSETYVSGNSAHAEGKSTIASGNYSHTEGESTSTNAPRAHAEGYSTTASGDSAHAEGRSTISSGDYSHTEGYLSKANGGSAHAEGIQTTASGSAAHAEGRNTTASGDYSHAESYYTTSEGLYSHAEGEVAYAKGKNSHAEGYYTSAIGISSHAEGRNTSANKIATHAEGYQSTADGDYAHAEGFNSLASGTISHAEGNATTASGINSHSEGSGTSASGNYSHAEGNATVASGNYSHAEGYNTKAQSDYSHAEGYNSKSQGNYSHAEGASTTAEANCTHAEGSSSKATAACSHAEGQASTASGSSSHAEGDHTTASGSYSHAEGYYTKATAYYSHAEGNFTTASSYSEHVSGLYNIPSKMEYVLIPENPEEFDPDKGFYPAGSVVKYNGTIYVAHNNSPTKNIPPYGCEYSWHEVTNPSGDPPVWSPDSLYAVNDVVKVSVGGHIYYYQCHTAITSTAVYPNLNPNGWHTQPAGSTYSHNAKVLETIGSGGGYFYHNARVLEASGNEYLTGDLYVRKDGYSLTDTGKRVATAAENPTNGHFAALDANGDLVDSGCKPSDYIVRTQKGSPNGVAELNNNGKVPSNQLPSYVDDIVEGYYYNGNFYSDSAHTTQITPENGKIYVDLTSNKTYRWGGSEYVEISASLALGETSSTAYRGDRGKTAYDHATDANRMTTAATSGLYKVAVTAEGHVAAVVAVEKADITALGIPAQDTTYGVATQNENGLMSAADKTRLDGLIVASTAETQAIIDEYGVSA